MMNVLVFSTIFPSRVDPIRGLYNLRTFEPLAEICNVRVVCPTSVWKRVLRPRELLFTPADRYGGIEVTYPTYLMIPRLAPQMHASSLYASVRSHVFSVSRTPPTDAIVGVFAYPDIAVAASLARDLDVPLVAIVVGSDMNDLAYRPALRGQIRQGLLRAAYVMTVSGGLRDKVVELGIPPARVVVQYNGVEGDKFTIRDRAAARSSLRISGNQRLLCFVGNIVREKGPDLLVDAIVHGVADDVHIAFLGDGDLKNELTARAATLGLTHRITFLGRQLPNQVSQWLSACDALCLPSRREGCPNAILEALASGRPVVAASVGGVPEIISDQNGCLVEPENPEALAAGINKVLRRSWEPLALRQSVPALSWKDVAATLHGLLSQAVSAYKPREPHVVQLAESHE